MSEITEEFHKITNSLLRDMFFQLLDIQDKYVSLSSNMKLSRTEINIIDIVGDNKSSILSNVARQLNLTLATTSVAMDRLVDKGLVTRRRMEFDRRKYWLELTDKGKVCYEKHKKFHREMMDELLANFPPEDYPLLMKSMNQLSDFFKAKAEEVRLLEIKSKK